MTYFAILDKVEIKCPPFNLKKLKAAHLSIYMRERNKKRVSVLMSHCCFPCSILQKSHLDDLFSNFS